MGRFNKRYWRFVKKKCHGYTLESQRSNLNKYLKKIKHYLNSDDKDTKILDIGCGFGYFLKICEEKTRWKLYGVDVSEFAITQARKILKSARRYSA